MNYRMIARVLGLILLAMAALMLLPLIAGLCFHERVTNFIITIAAAAALGGLLMLPKPRSRSLVARDGFVIVGFGWILISVIGALPFVLSGSIPHFYDAFFETASGLSTTGASVVTDIPAMPRGDLFWRLFTHWIGGMGVLVFLMAVLPMSGEHSMHIMRAEVPGPSVGKLVPRVRKTAMTLYMIYIALTLAEAFFLRLGGMSFYDALLHACATAGTGGFSTNPASIGGFNSLYIEIVVTVFMLLFGINFNLYFLLLIGRWREVAKNEELHWFLGIVLGSVLLLAAGCARSAGSDASAAAEPVGTPAVTAPATERANPTATPGVYLDGFFCSENAQVLPLTGRRIPARELAEALSLLPEVRRVEMRDAPYPPEERAMLRERYPSVVFQWPVELLGETFLSTASEISFAGRGVLMRIAPSSLRPSVTWTE